LDLVEAHVYHISHVKATREPRPGQREHQTVRQYRLYEQQFLRFLDTRHLEPSLNLLNPAVVEDCLLWLREAPPGPHTGKRGGMVSRQMFVTVMKVWARFLWRRGLYSHDPLAVLDKPRIPKVRRVPFSEEEAQRLTAAAAHMQNPALARLIFLMLADTGCRVGELVSLELQDVIDDAGKVTGAAIFRRTKNGRPRSVVYRVQDQRDGGPCVVAMKHWLRVRRAQPNVTALFVSEDGWPISDRRVRELHQACGMLAHIRDCHPHRWRHTHLSEAFAEGLREEEMRDRAGHMSDDVLRDYLTIGDRTREIVASRASLSQKWKL
jgi:integrase/recombinase XerD